MIIGIVSIKLCLLNGLKVCKTIPFSSWNKTPTLKTWMIHKFAKISSISLNFPSTKTIKNCERSWNIFGVIVCFNLKGNFHRLATSKRYFRYESVKQNIYRAVIKFTVIWLLTHASSINFITAVGKISISAFNSKWQIFSCAINIVQLTTSKNIPNMNFILRQFKADLNYCLAAKSYCLLLAMSFWRSFWKFWIDMI